MKKLFLHLICICSAISANASHIIGSEIGYKHLSGTTYEVYINIYADCNLDTSSSSSYPSLIGINTKAAVMLYDGVVLKDSVICIRQGNFGKEITPICQAASSNTKCKSLNGSIAGVTEFRFTGIVDLKKTSPNWRFAFQGKLFTSTAGRTYTITNIQINPSNGSLTYIEAKLDNSISANSCPILTTTPTPFFCINQTQQYNLGVVDDDHDSLHYELVSALEPSGATAVPVSYLPPQSPIYPLAVSNFSFNPLNGQLSFTPNMVQKSLVVYRITEYRNGKFVGSMMREMNFTVEGNCSNQSPIASITSTQAGKIISPNTIEVCNADSFISFSIHAQDPDNQNIEVEITGEPQGMTHSLIGNNTQTPLIQMSFTLPQPITNGNRYHFFVSYQDDYCPISSKQQIVYTVVVTDPITTTTKVVNESCVPGNDGKINLVASSINGSIEFAFNGSSYQKVDSFQNLSAGVYPIFIRDSLGCVSPLNVLVDSATQIVIDDIVTNNISCFNKNDGSALIKSLPDTLATSFTLYPGGVISSTKKFDNLRDTIFTVIANAPFGCSDTSTFTITRPLRIAFTDVSISNNNCDKNTGRIELITNNAVPAEYSITPRQQTNTNGKFGGLSGGFYLITLLDTNGCYRDTVLEVKDIPNSLTLSFKKSDVSCLGDGDDGWAQAFVGGGEQPYTYLWNTYPAPSVAASSIHNQRAGIKQLNVIDAIGCDTKGYVIINPANCCEKVFIPNAFTPNGDLQNDIFRMRTPLAITEVKFIVMNRWGQKVWGTDNHLDGWDGNYKNGKPAEVGSYYYLLQYRCDADKNVHQLKGDIMIIR